MREGHREGYDAAQVCLNGHPINDSSRNFPEHNQDYCDKCGEPTITQCQSCKADVRGHFFGNVSVHYRPPSFCHNCGKAYPWTGAKLTAAREFADELEGLDSQEREALKKTLDDLVGDTPQTTVAATRFKKLAAKAGKTAAEGFRELLIDVVAATAKKIIWGL